MSLPPVLQYELGQDRSVRLSSGQDLSRRPAAQRGAVAAVRDRVGQAFVSAGRRIMSDPPVYEMRVADAHHLS